MKIIALQENLKRGIGVVSYAVGKNPNLPILSSILIRANSSGILIAATNMEAAIFFPLRGKILTEGSCVVNGKTLLDYILLLPNQKIVLEFSDNSLIIKTEQHKTKILADKDEDYPLSLSDISGDQCVFKANDFAGMLTRVMFAVGTNDNHIELSGVFCDFKKNEVIFAATDSFRLSEQKIQINTQGISDKNMIIPAKIARDIIKIISMITNDNSDIEVIFNKNQVMFKVDDIEVVSQLIDGQYPEYKTIIPSEFKTTVTMNRANILRVMRISRLFSNETTNEVLLQFNNKENLVVITSESGKVGGNTTKEKVKIIGDDNSVALNYRYLMEGLQNIDSEEFIFKMIDNNTPCVLTGTSDNGYMYLIMPIKK